MAGGAVAEELFERGLCLPSGSSLTAGAAGDSDRRSIAADPRAAPDPAPRARCERNAMELPNIINEIPPRVRSSARPACPDRRRERAGVLAAVRRRSRRRRYRRAAVRDAALAARDPRRWCSCPSGSTRGCGATPASRTCAASSARWASSSAVFALVVQSRSAGVLSAVDLHHRLAAADLPDGGGLRVDAPRLCASCPRGAAARRVLIFGAGDAGEMIVRDMNDDPRLRLPAGRVRRRRPGQGRPAHPRRAGARHAARPDGHHREAHGRDEVLIAIPDADPATVRAVVRALEPFKVPIKTLPNLRDIIDGRSTSSRSAAWRSRTCWRGAGRPRPGAAPAPDRRPAGDGHRRRRLDRLRAVPADRRARSRRRW